MALTKITSRILDSSGVTILGTIATGVWQGTAINQTYLVGQSGTNTGDETLARINALDVTELGTISSGVWNGTAINQTYLVGQSGTNTGDQTTISGNAGSVTNGVYTVGNQTIGGTKTFSGGGIFSSSSQGKLKLVASSNEYLSLEFANASGTTQWEISKNNTHDLYFYKGGYKMILKSGGNVGIGTTSPISGFKLDVQGGDFRVGDDANQGFEAGYSAGSGNVFIQGYNRGTSSFVNMILNNALTITSGGNVGIGTTSPGHPLDVNGTIRGNRLRILPNGVNNSYIFVDSNATFAGALSIQAGEGSSGYGGTFIAYGHSHASRAGFVSAGISNGSNGKFTVMNHGNGSGSDVFSVNTNGSVSLYNSNTAVIGRPYMTGTLANGASITINANGAGGDQSVGFIAVSCVPNISAEGGAVALFSHIHTQGANGYTQMQLRNENNITISESSGQFTISNSSGHTAHYNFKVLNIIDKSTTILGI